MNDFFGHRLDLRSIGLFRICLAAILIVDLFYYRLNFYDIFYSNEGFLDHSLWQTMIHEGQDLWIWNWSLFSSFEGAWFAVLVILLCILSAVFFGIGIWPRFWGTVLLIGYFSLLQRNPLITSTHERLLIVFLIFALVLPVEKMFCYKSKKSGEEIFSYEYRGIPVVVFLLYMSLFYFLNAFLKDGESWAGGEAIRFAIKGNLHIKPWVSHLSIIDSWLNNLTFFIRGFEFSLAALLLLPSKKAWPQVIAAFLILLFHWFLFLFFSFGIFPLILSLTSVLLIPGVFWDLIYKKLKIVTRRMLPPLKATPITIGFSIFILSLTVWRLSSRSKALAPYIPAPGLIRALEYTPIFPLEWPLYAPEVSSAPGWVRLKGTTLKNQQVDIWSGKNYDPTSQDLSAYQVAPWQQFIRISFIQHSSYKDILAQGWLRFEFQKWNSLHPKQQLKGIYLVRFEEDLRQPLSPPRVSNLAQYTPKN